MCIKRSKLHGMQLVWKRQFYWSNQQNGSQESCYRTFDVPKDSLRRRLQRLEKSNTGDNTGILHKKIIGRFPNVLSEGQEEELKNI